MAKVIVTRHAALVDYLVEKGLISDSDQVVAHADESTVRGKHVIGVLPLRLAAHAASITEIPLDLTPGDRGKELTLDRVREIAGAPVTYRVTRA